MLPMRVPAVLLLTVAASAALGAPPAQAKNTRLSYGLSLDVSMEIVVKETFESIQTCTPGEKGSVEYTFDYESDVPGSKKDPGSTELNLINGVGGTAKASRGVAGGGKERGTPGPWEFSLDDCIDSTDVKLPVGVEAPQCKPLAGRVDSWLLTDGPSEEELTPLTSDGTLLVNRIGGGVQNPSCLRMFQRLDSADDIVDWNLGASAVAGAAGAGVGQAFKIDLPKLSGNLMQVAGKKGRSTRKFTVTGPCYATKGTSLVNNVGPTFGSARYETCSVSGSGVLVLKRTTKVTKLKF